MIVLAIEDNRQEMALLREALSNLANITILVEHRVRQLSCSLPTIGPTISPAPTTWDSAAI